MRRIVILLVLGGAFATSVSAAAPDEWNPPEVPQHKNNDKLRTLLSVINAVRKLEHDLDENQQQLRENPEARDDKLRLENNLKKFRKVLKMLDQSNTELDDQQDKIASVLRHIQLHFSEPARATTEVAPRWFRKKDKAKEGINGNTRLEIPLSPKAETKSSKQTPRKMKDPYNYKFKLSSRDNEISKISKESDSRSSSSKSSQSSESESKDSSSSAERNRKPKGSRMKLHHNDFKSFSSSISSKSDSREIKDSSSSEKKRRPAARSHLPPNVNSFWVDYWIPGALPKPTPKQKTKRNSDESDSKSSVSSSETK